MVIIVVLNTTTTILIVCKTSRIITVITFHPLVLDVVVSFEGEGRYDMAEIHGGNNARHTLLTRSHGNDPTPRRAPEGWNAEEDGPTT